MNKETAIGSVSFLVGIWFVFSLMVLFPEHTRYAVNGHTYLVTKNGDTFTQTNSIEIKMNDKGVLEIKEVK